jgi:ribosomal protein S18 acetylase RimI-like enzyme
MAGLDLTQRTLYERMEANMVAAWDEVAAGSPDASLERLPGAVAGLFPAGPERDFYNNALLARGLDGAESTKAVSAVARAYAEAGVGKYAVWAHESEAASIAELQRRGYRIDTWTRAMVMSLDWLPALPGDERIEVGDWQDYLAILTALGGTEGLLADVDGDAFEVLVATVDGVRVAAALAYDHDGDCGIYNVGTLPHARRRGLGTALTALHLHHARERGCATASLQATEMAEGVYGAIGFRDLGRFIEYVAWR